MRLYRTTVNGIIMNNDHHHHHQEPTPQLGVSLMGMSVAERLGGVLVLLALLWSIVGWAMGGGE